VRRRWACEVGLANLTPFVGAHGDGPLEERVVAATANEVHAGLDAHAARAIDGADLADNGPAARPGEDEVRLSRWKDERAATLRALPELR
jgi:hypothetical protein